MLSVGIKRPRKLVQFFVNSVANQHKLACVAKYDEAVNKLNQLQCNNMGLGEKKHKGLGLVVMKEFLERVNVRDDDINKMKIIHVTGSKGKGSTCAFVESILRHSGFTTGFYSSPHLIEVRERIQINGLPIPHDLFANYFWKVYDLLDSSKDEYSVEMPSYKFFLTTMAFFVFKHEAVDVVVMEVGIGGAYDTTNVIKHPAACGISLIEIEHVKRLGNSMESIAWHKVGIFKENVPAFTVQQSGKAIQVMDKRAKEIGTSLNVVSDLSEYWEQNNITLGISGDHQKTNASLAVQLAYCWLNNGSLAPPLSLKSSFLKGLENCKWNGRTQILKFNNITFYLDGAHTQTSMVCVAEWFNKEAAKEQNKLKIACSKILSFNLTGDRNVHELLSLLYPCNFSYSIFTPNVATFSSLNFNDQVNFKNSAQNQLKVASSIHDEWNNICSSQSENQSQISSSLFPSVADAICCLANDRDEKIYHKSYANSLHKNFKPILPGNHLQVLVTGSLFLVGSYLCILKPKLNM